MSNIRYVLRLFGILETLRDLGKNCGASEETEHLLKFITRLQTWSLLIYYPLEHMYWLSSQGIYPLRHATSFSLWSCRAWAFYILLDLIGDSYRLYLLTYETSEAWKVSGASRNMFPSSYLQETYVKNLDMPRNLLISSRRRAIYVKSIMNLCDLPLAIAWSLNRDLLSPLALILCGCISSSIGLYVKWHRS